MNTTIPPEHRLTICSLSRQRVYTRDLRSQHHKLTGLVREALGKTSEEFTGPVGGLLISALPKHGNEYGLPYAVAAEPFPLPLQFGIVCWDEAGAEYWWGLVAQFEHANPIRRSRGAIEFKLPERPAAPWAATVLLDSEALELEFLLDALRTAEEIIPAAIIANRRGDPMPVERMATCPQCEKRMRILPPSGDYVPLPGALAICGHCRASVVLQAGDTVRLATEAEAKEIRGAMNRARAVSLSNLSRQRGDA